MSGGRPPLGSDHIATLETDELTKERLAVVLETLQGSLPVKEAAERLGISESRFHELRKQALQAAADSLAPRRPGRPRKVEPGEMDRIQELEGKVRELELDLDVARTRTELALTQPHVLLDPSKKAGKRGAQELTEEERKKIKKDRQKQEKRKRKQRRKRGP